MAQGMNIFFSWRVPEYAKGKQGFISHARISGL
jgi:hypothetical protein